MQHLAEEVCAVRISKQTHSEWQFVCFIASSANTFVCSCRVLLIGMFQSAGLPSHTQVGISAPPAHLRTPYQVTSFGHLIRGSPLLAQRSELRPKEDPVRLAVIDRPSRPLRPALISLHWQIRPFSMVLLFIFFIDCVASLTSGRHRAFSSRRRGPGDCVGQYQSPGQR